MKTPVAFFILLLVVISRTPAATLYVSLASTNPVPPYTDWNTAAANIQDAVDASTNGDLILVTNGVYQTGGRTVNGYTLTNRVVIDKAVMVQSVNGPAVTVIQGNPLIGANAVRCAYLTNNAILIGFTLAFGATLSAGDAAHERSGGGAWCEGTNVLLSTCTLVTNAANVDAGGVYSGALTNCVLGFNSAAVGYGGGAKYSTLNNCRVTNNLSGYGSGVAFGTLNNCLVAGNEGDGAEGGTLNNCTIVGNGGLGANGCTLNNCLIYYNGIIQRSIWGDVYQSRITNCCLSSLGNSFGPNNITNPPAFVNLAHGNYQLQIGSPCINAGTNDYAPLGPDLAGNPRIAGGTVDIGAFESDYTNLTGFHFVSQSSTNPVPPYTNWLTAATNIQDAVAVAQSGDTVIVGAGSYTNGGTVLYGQETNRVLVTNAITLLGMSDLFGTNMSGAMIVGGIHTRCVYLGSNAVLSGFILANGQGGNGGNPIYELSGGGAWCEPGGVLSNCLITGNNNVWDYGAGVFGGTVCDSAIVGNSTTAGGYGGGACSNSLINCLLVGNSSASGGGAAYSKLAGCVVSNNTATSGGGLYFGVIDNSLISSNSAGSGGGAYSNVLNNCILQNNFAASAGGGAYGSALVNCTIVSNYAGSWGGGTYWGSVSNSVIYYNSSPKNPNYQIFQTNIPGFCCTTPAPPGGLGNITNEPGFVNLAGGDDHLQAGSSCINSGNNAYLTTATDLDGNPRIVGGTVDIGAYEYQAPTSVISYAWLQEYGLPTDGTADYVDSDHDGLNNYQEWIAGTNPTNALSVLVMLPPVPTNNPAGLVAGWESVSNRTYFLQSSTNLTAHPAFTTIQSNIAGQAATTSYMDTNAVGYGPFFYRVGVQP